MPPDDGPVTKQDLRDAESRIKEFLQNELGHRDVPISDLLEWRKEFFYDEDSPWRKRGQRIQDLENLARLVKWAIGLLTPIAGLATIEIARLILAALRGGP